MEQIESWEIGLHKYSQLNFDKGARKYNGENTVFSTDDARTTRYLHIKKWIQTKPYIPLQKLSQNE